MKPIDHRERPGDGFLAALDDPTATVAFSAGRERSTLLVAFGGMAGRFGLPNFEFQRLTSALEVDRLFVRDVRQAWYQRGVEGLGDTIPEIARGLERRTRGYQRTVFIGNSAGGYAALLFGALVGATSVQAFVPRTFLGAALRLRHRDRRYARHVPRLYRSPDLRAYGDLRRVIREAGTTALHIHYDEHHRLDRVHALRVDGPTVVLHGHRTGRHELVRELRDSGELLQLLTAAVTRR